MTASPKGRIVTVLEMKALAALSASAQRSAHHIGGLWLKGPLAPA